MRRLMRAATMSLLLLLSVAATASGSGRITSGHGLDSTAFGADWPFLVGLVDRSAATEFDGQFCGGMLIDDRHVLTAAHCVVAVEEGIRYRNAPSSVGITYGSVTLDERRRRPDRLAPVQTIFVHPSYVAERDQWDVALLRLARPITTTGTIPLLSSADEASIGLGTVPVQARIAGWGDTNPLRDDCCVPATARAASLPIHPTDTCTRNAETSPLYFFSEYQICAGTRRQGGRLGFDTCQGDSGGPLVIDVAGVRKLAGITSRGAGCGQSYFGQYTRASAVLDWVTSIPGSLPEDAREPIAGPLDSEPPTAITTSRAGRGRLRVSWSAPTTGPAPTSYTVWMRVGAPAEAIDVYLGRSSTTTLNARIPYGRRGGRYPLLVRSFVANGESPAARAVSVPLG